jgi:hypothetical protein
VVDTLRRDVKKPALGLECGLRLVSYALLGLLVAEVLVRIPAYGLVWLGHDYQTYMDATRGWLAGGSFYPAYQLSGPYAVVEREILYPPVALWLFVPFTTLPAMLWWAPIGIVSWIVWQQRPGPLARVIILALLVTPIEDATSWAVELVGNGNPGMWAAAFVALATRYPFFGSWTLVKPSLAPLALVGVRSRAWWVGLAVLVALAVPLGAEWLDYSMVLRNAQASVLYSLPNVTLCLVPLVGLLPLRAGRTVERSGRTVERSVRQGSGGERVRPRFRWNVQLPSLRGS